MWRYHTGGLGSLGKSVQHPCGTSIPVSAGAVPQYGGWLCCWGGHIFSLPGGWDKWGHGCRTSNISKTRCWGVTLLEIWLPVFILFILSLWLRRYVLTSTFIALFQFSLDSITLWHLKSIHGRQSIVNHYITYRHLSSWWTCIHRGLHLGQGGMDWTNLLSHNYSVLQNLIW